MKSIYSILLPLVILLLFTKCIMTDPSLEDDIDHHNAKNNTEAVISIANYSPQTNQARTTPYSNEILLDKTESSIHTSMMQEEWNNKTQPSTRTTWPNSSNTVSWVTDDRVGIYMQSSTGVTNIDTDRHNVQHSVTTSGTLTPIDSPLYFSRPYSTANNMTFYAYYPYSSAAPTNSMSINYNLPSNQSANASLANADIMCATSTPTNGSSPSISLPFNHKMVLLSFQIKSLITSGTLSKVELEGAAITNTGTLNLKTSALSTNTSTTFTPYVITNQTVSPSQSAFIDIIVNPFSFTSNLFGNNLKVTLTFKLLGLELPVTHTTYLVSSGTFVGGTRYIYTLTVTVSL